MATHAKPPAEKGKPDASTEARTPHDAPSPTHPTAEEAAARRARAFRLRTEFGMDNTLIARAIGDVHPTTVGRWIATEQRKLRKQYEAGGRFYPAEVVGVMIDRAERVRRLAMQTYQTTDDVRARMRALVVALRADAQAVGLLQDVSLLPHDLGTIRLEQQREKFSAGEIRRLAEELRKRGAFAPNGDGADPLADNIDLVPAGEKEFLYGSPDADNVIDGETVHADTDADDEP